MNNIVSKLSSRNFDKCFKVSVIIIEGGNLSRLRFTINNFCVRPDII